MKYSKIKPFEQAYVLNVDGSNSEELAKEIRKIVRLKKSEKLFDCVGTLRDGEVNFYPNYYDLEMVYFISANGNHFSVATHEKDVFEGDFDSLIAFLLKLDFPHEKLFSLPHTHNYLEDVEDVDRVGHHKWIIDQRLSNTKPCWGDKTKTQRKSFDLETCEYLKECDANHNRANG